jgi:DNA-binding protein H-NS
MAKSNGRLTQGQVATWFNGLSIDAQRSVLTTLGNAHGKVRQQQIRELRRQLAALEAPIGARRKRKVAAVKVKYRNKATGETWSGRGRMAGWLAAKVKGGEKAAKYLVG